MKGFQKLNLLQKISLIVLLCSILFFVAYGVYDIVVHAFEAVPVPEFDYGTLLSSIGVILGVLSVIGIVVGHKVDERKTKVTSDIETIKEEETENPEKNIER